MVSTLTCRGKKKNGLKRQVSKPQAGGKRGVIRRDRGSERSS